ncbi:MAG: glycosyltransferase [Rikenellaceae bacterium]|nr:glycosyltransferase [Rikenellaceae bacterium]
MVGESTRARLPLVSVPMPVYNCVGVSFCRYRECTGQTFADMELVIVNDCSTDRSAAVIDSYTDPRIVIVHNESNMGIAASMKKGAAVCRGRYIAAWAGTTFAIPDASSARWLLWKPIRRSVYAEPGPGGSTGLAGPPGRCETLCETAK